MNTLKILHTLVLATALLAPACQAEQDATAESARPAGVAAPASMEEARAGGSPYSFDAPAASMPLPAELKEISGLTVLADGRLAAVQDEQGVLYLLNAESG